MDSVNFFNDMDLFVFCVLPYEVIYYSLFKI